MWRTLLTGYQYVLLVYFSSLNILYALFSCIGLRAIVVVFAREFSQGVAARPARAGRLQARVHPRAGP
jgi:hypothetical protein